MTPRLLVIALAAVLSRAPAARATPAEDPKALLAEGRALENAGSWDKARAVYVRLEANKRYAGEALFHQAWAAFSAGDNDAALTLAARAAQVGGPRTQDAKFLYGDALYRSGQYQRAREVYLALHAVTAGEAKAAARKKIAAANRQLKLPEDDLGVRAAGAAPTSPAASPPASPPAAPKLDTAAAGELYRQAVAAFQKDDLDAAKTFALKAASESGAYTVDAKVLYGDILVRRGEFARAKDVFVALRKLTTGDVRSIVTAKVVATNRSLKLPDTDGITD